MKKIIILLIIFILGNEFKLHSHQNIRYSIFWLLNNTTVNTDIVASTQFSSADLNPPELKGYLEEVRSDTLFVKILYKEHISAGWAAGTYRLDTFTNIALPLAINYLNVSGNMIKVNSQGQITDTLWDESDSTFALHPTSLSEHKSLIPPINLYPNPVNNNIFIDKNVDFEKVHIFNAIGQKVGVFSKTVNAEINVSTLTKGVYFIWIIGKKEEVIGVGKFVKQE